LLRTRYATLTCVNADPKISRRKTFVVRNARVGLDLEQLLYDTTVAYPSNQVQSRVTRLISRIHHFRHEAHQAERLCNGRFKRSCAKSGRVAANKELEKGLQVVLARGGSTFDATCDCDVVQNGTTLSVTQFDKRSQNLQQLRKAAVVKAVCHLHRCHQRSLPSYVSSIYVSSFRYEQSHQ
jgi:hypothetical protein